MTERRCSRCGHPDHWHRADDSQDCQIEQWKFHCIGYDCMKPGFVGGTPETRCGCPDFFSHPDKVGEAGR